MVKKKKRSFMSKLFSRRILLLIQFIVSIIFLGCIYILKMLPMKYYLLLCGIIFLLWMLSSLLIKSGIKKKKRENKYARLIFGKLLSLILSIALGFVSVMAFKGNNFLSNITGSFTQTRVICMYVKKESAIKSLSDVKDNTEIGIASEKGSKNITSAIAKIENKANKDYLTGLYNRRYLFDFGNDIYKDCKEKNKVFAIAIIDIDNFKKINDTYGHNFGDIAIKEVANILNKNITTNGLISRLGGEEFCICFYNRSENEIKDLLEYIRKDFEDNIIKINDRELKYTV